MRSSGRNLQRKGEELITAGRGLENTEGDVQGLDQARMKGLALGKGRYKDKVVKLRVRESGHQSEL